MKSLQSISGQLYINIIWLKFKSACFVHSLGGQSVWLNQLAPKLVGVSCQWKRFQFTLQNLEYDFEVSKLELIPRIKSIKI